MKRFVSRLGARRALAVGLLALLATVVGCGKGALVLRVDILSFTPQLQSPFAFPAIPAAPGGLALPETTLVDAQDVNLIEGLGDAADIRDVSLRLQSIATATSGTGVDTVRVYLSDVNTDPLTTAPVMTQVLTFGATPDTATSEIGGDGSLAALFSQKQLRVSVTTSFRGPSSGAALAGSLRISELSAVVVAGRKLQ